MKDTCEQEGTKLHMSVWYSPKLNGVAEQTIRVLTSAVCAMLHDSGLPKSLWAEAFNAATTCIIGRQRRHWAVVCHLRSFTGRNQTFRTYVHSARRLPSLSRQNDRGSLTIGRRCVSYEGGRLPGLGPKGRVVVESRDSVFFEDGLPPPILNYSRPQLTNEDEPTAQPAPDHTTEPPTLPAAPDAPAPTLLFTASLEAMHDHGPTTTPHLRIIVHLLGRCRTQRRIR